MKVHVVLKIRRPSPETISRVVEAGRLANVNESRAKRFGIVTGDVPEGDQSLIAALSNLPEVEAVEPDETRCALA